VTVGEGDADAAGVDDVVLEMPPGAGAHAHRSTNAAGTRARMS
jgi:hypothetical protein